MHLRKPPPFILWLLLIPTLRLLLLLLSSLTRQIDHRSIIVPKWMDKVCESSVSVSVQRPQIDELTSIMMMDFIRIFDRFSGFIVSQLVSEHTKYQGTREKEPPEMRRTTQSDNQVVV